MKGPISSPHGLHKSPPFRILTGLTGFLIILSFFLYTQLETISRDDDVLPGSSGGDGQAWDMRSMRHHKKKKSRGGIFDGMKLGRGGGSMADRILQFSTYKQHEAKRRAKSGVLSDREEFERKYSYGSDEELQQKVQALRISDLEVVKEDIPYDIYNCPEDPPTNYPFAWNVRNVLENWNPDNTDIPSKVYQGLCVFDWKKDYDKALKYRNAEVPFVIQHAPEVMKASLRWMHNDGQYLKDLLGDESIRNEHSHNNHFMYWKTLRPDPNFKPPTDMVELTFDDWYRHAKELDQFSAQEQTSQEHWYFRLNALFDKHSYVYEELPFFDPSLGTSMTMITPEEHRGINCRFGMKGITAETHFDSSSNFIALMGGQRRYILAHPNQCVQMELYPQDHPSGRHTSIEWSEFDFNKDTQDRPFLHAKVNEVVMQAGDLMYLPTYWFHFIVSLNLNYQCNSRSGDSRDYESDIYNCGFTPATAIKRKKKH